MDYKLNRRYFESINWLYIAISGVIGLAVLYFIILIGIVILLGIGVYIYFKLKDLPTDEDIDAELQQQVNKAVQKGFEKLGLDPEEVKPKQMKVIHGPLLEPISFSPYTKRGQDDKVRSSNYEVVLFYLNEQQLSFYNYSFSITDDESNEVVDEYFYRDIISMSTASLTTLFYDNGKKRDEFFNHEVMRLTIAGTENLEFSIQDPETVEFDVLNMKDQIREKKSA